jgi:hypothetical protein
MNVVPVVTGKVQSDQVIHDQIRTDL